MGARETVVQGRHDTYDTKTERPLQLPARVTPRAIEMDVAMNGCPMPAPIYRSIYIPRHHQPELQNTPTNEFPTNGALLEVE
jgi:hypothetical protein